MHYTIPHRIVTECSKTAKNSSDSDPTTERLPDEPHSVFSPSLSMESDQATMSESDDDSEEFKKVTLKPRWRLSLSMGDLSTQEQEKGRGRRFRLKNRGTISRMLQDGENHEVWTPGLRQSIKRSYHDSQVCICELK